MIRDGKLLYHITELDNLENIINFGLLSREELSLYDVKFTNVADREILDFRRKHKLQKYVPFHFFPNTPFAGSVQKNNSKYEFIYLCLQRHLAKKHRFKIIPQHPLSMTSFKMYNFDEGMEIINWDIMERRDYHDYECREICMAECLYNHPIPINWFNCIYVRNEEIKNYVQEILGQYNIEKIYINIMPSWFCS